MHLIVKVIISSSSKTHGQSRIPIHLLITHWTFRIFMNNPCAIPIGSFTFSWRKYSVLVSLIPLMPTHASINMSCFYDDIFMPQKKNLGALLSQSGIEDKYSWKREKFNELAHGQYASVGFRRCYPNNVLKMFKAAMLVISKINQCDVILTTCSSILFHKKVFVTWPFCYPISASFKVMVTLLPILGITWLLGILVPVSDVFHYLFIIGTSMQVYYYFMIKNVLTKLYK